MVAPVHVTVRKKPVTLTQKKSTQYKHILHIVLSLFCTSASIDLQHSDSVNVIYLTVCSLDKPSGKKEKPVSNRAGPAAQHHAIRFDV